MKKSTKAKAMPSEKAKNLVALIFQAYESGEDGGQTSVAEYVDTAIAEARLAALEEAAEAVSDFWMVGENADDQTHPSVLIRALAASTAAHRGGNGNG